MNRWWLVILVWLVAMIQGWFFSALALPWLTPNLILIILLVVTLRRGWQLSIGLALWAGFWLDIASKSFLGFYMLLLTLFVLLVRMLKHRGIDFSFSISTPLVLGLASFAFSLAQLLRLIGTSPAMGGLGLVVLGWAWQAMLTALLGWLVVGRLESAVAPARSVGVRP